MKHIFTDTIVLLNDLENMEMLLKKGIEFSVDHQVPLQVIYVHETPLFQLPDIFLAKEKRGDSGLDKEKVRKVIQDTIKALDLEHQHAVLVYENDTLNRILSLVKERKQVLVITRYQEELLAKLIAKTPYAYCVVKESKENYEKIALPIDLEDDFDKCIQTSQHIFTKGKINLIHDYRFLQENFMISEDYMGIGATSTQTELEAVEAFKELQKKTFNEYLKKYNLEGAFIVGEDVLYEDIVKHIEKNHYDLTVLYRNEKEILFTSSMIMGLMKEINTDFFVCQE